MTPLVLAVAEGIIVHELLKYVAVGIIEIPLRDLDEDRKAVTKALPCSLRVCLLGFPDTARSSCNRIVAFIKERILPDKYFPQRNWP